MLWIVVGALVLIWLILLLMGKSGFVHILPISALSIVVAQIAADRRAAM